MREEVDEQMISWLDSTACSHSSREVERGERAQGGVCAHKKVIPPHLAPPGPSTVALSALGAVSTELDTAF